jgi:RNA polymerase sigma-70 factor (ECF subfamily)
LSSREWILFYNIRTARRKSKACMPPLAATVANLFEEHRSFLWGLCYRLTGSAADAEDLVQETFARAIEHPPARTDEPWRPWLVRVAMNLGRDFLRRRRRRSYIGVWLPSPIDTGDEASPPSYEPTFAGGMSAEGRYDLLESVSIAFLVAL